ncbi:MAG: bifunctional UDP-N-acetylglucosamine diphosphorylase/glucosamine-1-phosphate N-acetyltransferase GlmU [Alphaproteobacteria bacterium]|nr:bifunctional UDP-N-acetylglucosamine diphosphorylase/glucosamine-1-phosphate N-acetyltransferase GlmU [Alphaproteobacteria bacterium]
MSALQVIILAAGDGTRFKSRTSKVLHKVAGRPILHHVCQAATDAGAATIAVVTAPDKPDIEASVAKAFPAARFFIQAERLGTAHAARMAEPAYAGAEGVVAVVYGDHPLLRGDNFAEVLRRIEAGFDGAVLGFEPEDPTGYGRLITDGETLVDIREHRDASAAEREIGRCNACILAFRAEIFSELIGRIGRDNAQNEYYLGDLVPLANKAGYRVGFALAPEADVMGVNSRDQLARAEGLYQERLRLKAMRDGVTLIDPKTVYFAWDTRIAPDVTVEPGVFFGPGVTIATGAVIKAYSHIEGAHVGENCQVGPFARLRPGAELMTGARAGNFVEIKNARIADGAKVNHLTYIGDAHIGARANIGAGTITCNYDGVNKHLTEIGADSFIGSNSALVAPVRIGEGAYIASGSVVTEDVPDDAMAVARGRQINKPGHAATLRARAEAFKANKTKG